MSVSLEGIRQARKRIEGSIYFSPAPRSEALSRMTGQQVYLKLDNLQRTGAFKERGALNKILTLSDTEKHAG
jgi:threonine dehydratase